jgi:hypothetical protein
VLRPELVGSPRPPMKVSSAVNGGGKLGHMPAAEWGVQRGVF